MFKAGEISLESATLFSGQPYLGHLIVQVPDKEIVLPKLNAFPEKSAVPGWSCLFFKSNSVDGRAVVGRGKAIGKRMKNLKDKIENIIIIVGVEVLKESSQRERESENCRIYFDCIIHKSENDDTITY